MAQKELTKEEIMKLKVDDNTKKLYLEAMKMGAKIILLNETAEGYDIGMLFEPIAKH